MGWQSDVRLIILTGLGEIPDMGSFLSLIVRIAWSDGKSAESIFGEIEEEVIHLVDAEIVKAEMDQLRQSINAYKDEINEFKNGSSSARVANMTNLVDSGWGIMRELTDSNAKDIDRMKHFIPLAAAFLPLHMGILRLRALHGLEIYNVKKPNSLWFNDLLKARDAYLNYVKAAYPKLREWRGNQITYDPTRGAMGPRATITDSETGITQDYYDTSSSLGYDELYTDIKTYTLARWDIEMNAVMYPFYMIDGYLLNIPNFAYHTKPPQQPLQDLMTIKQQPFYLGTHDFICPKDEKVSSNSGIENPLVQFDGNMTNDVGGTITQIDVYYDQIINGLQFTYSNNRLGTLVANREGSHNSILLDNRKIVQVRTLWFMCEMCQIEFIFDNGISFGPFGQPQENAIEIVTECPPFYTLTAVQMRQCQALRSNLNVLGEGIGALSFEYSWDPTPKTKSGSDLVPAGSNLAAGMQLDEQVDIVYPQKDGSLYVEWACAGNDWVTAPAKIVDAGIASKNTHLAVIKPCRENREVELTTGFDVFFTGISGGLYISSVIGEGKWDKPKQVPHCQQVPADSPLAAVMQTPDQLDVFYIKDNGLYVTWAFLNGSLVWNDTPMLICEVPEGAGLAAAKQRPFQTDVFSTKENGGLYVNYEVNNGAWSTDPLAIIDAKEGLVPAGAGLAAAQQSDGQQLNVFFIGKDGGLYTTYVRGGGAWSKPILMKPDIANPGAPITSIQQTTGIIVFFVDKEGKLQIVWV